MPYSAQPYKAI